MNEEEKGEENIDMEDYYDEDFEQNLKMFEQRLDSHHMSRNQSNGSVKLKPNLSQDWLERIKSESNKSFSENKEIK